MNNMLIPMLKAINNMLRDDDCEHQIFLAKVSCAKDILAELIEHLNKPNNSCTLGVDEDYESLDDEAILAKQELLK